MIPVRAHARQAISLVGSVLIAAVALTACGHSTATSPAGTTTSSSAQPAPSSGPSTPGGATSPGPSAANQVAGFAAAAQSADAQIRHAAALINGGIGRTSMRFAPATLAAIRAIDITSAARAIPAGLPPGLLRAVIVVYGDLAARKGSLSGVLLYDPESTSLPIGGPDAKGVLRCLHNGAPAAARFGADLSAMLALARQIPPVTLAGPESRAAAEVAVRVESISKVNFCSYDCGGYAPTQLEPIFWNPATRPGHYDGTIGQMTRFQADYHAGQGWVVSINAC